MKNCKIGLEFCKYKKSIKIKSVSYDINTQLTTFDSLSIKNEYQTMSAEQSIEERNIKLKILEGKEKSVGVNILFSFENWSEDNFVFCPAALYNGNRFESIALKYPPILTPSMQNSSGSPIISDVPRLNWDRGPSKVQLSVGDMATPCVGFLDNKNKRGFLLFFEQRNLVGDFGISIIESESRDKMELRIMSPCVREAYKYGMCTTNDESDDVGILIKKDDIIDFKYSIHDFECGSLQEFYDRFFMYRKKFCNLDEKNNLLSFSEAFDLIEEKYNERNWLEGSGFYKSSEASSSICRQWQTGWVGGLMSTLPFLSEGKDISKKRAMSELDFVSEKLAAKSGFFYGIYCDEQAYGDVFGNVEKNAITMSRKNADALFFMSKNLLTLKKAKVEIKEAWQITLRRLADAFVLFYKKNGDIGQHINIDTMEIYLGGTSSAAILGAGLCLAYKYFLDEEYLTIAKKVSQHYYDKFVSLGYTNAGPGEIAQCPDSESAYGMLESFMLLYECDLDRKWLEYAEYMAKICASWCVSYDYKYDKYSQFGERKIKTTGSIWASVQNKHSAPAICTLSGFALLKLFRATNNILYLDLLKDISHNSTQYVNTKERPFRKSYVWHNGKAKRIKQFRIKYCNLLLKLRSKNIIKKDSKIFNASFNNYGRMDERVNLSDWEGKNNIGELPGGSCWCEVSVMLTYLEIPAAYIQPDTSFVYTFDHLICKVIKDDEKELAVSFVNPTQRDAIYRVLVENSSETKTLIYDSVYCNYNSFTIKQGECLTKTFSKKEAKCLQ